MTEAQEKTMIEVSNFADLNECRTVIEAYERCKANAHVYGSELFDGRIMFITSFHATDVATRRILQGWRNRAAATASELIGRQLYADNIQVVRWDGQAMPPHQDDRHPDGSAHNTPWREFAGVIYLNDGYVGGDIYFPETGERYSPVAGSLAIFPGEAWHGVDAVASGLRYTSPMWFTGDKTWEDPLVKVVF